jgi:hypothetical protein
MTIYSGGCQCGKVRFTVALDDLGKPVACNCSRCQRLGSLLVFAPEAAFTLQSGEGEMTEYLFNSGQIHHLFCRTCGVQSFSRAPGHGMVAVNVNCLDGVEPRALDYVLHDGRAQ